MTTELSLLFCPECGRDCLAEAPPCTDSADSGGGHGDHLADDCPERVCVECGTALMLDAPLFQLDERRTPGRRHAA